MLSDLPTEILLRIVSNLPVQDIHSITLLSKPFRDLIAVNEKVVYRSAAILHGFVQSVQKVDIWDATVGLEDVKLPSSTGWLDGVDSWQELCRKHFRVNSAWLGKTTGTIPLNTIKASGNRVHRIKVDEVERTVIATTRRGGLVVTAIDTLEVLWSLPIAYVPEYSHVEYDNGFIVFNRPTDAIEVWRRSSDSFNPETYLPCKPSPLQTAVCQDPLPSFPETYPPVFETPPDPSIQVPRRGMYYPFATLRHPAVTRAYRFVYPELLVASKDARKAYIWNIPTATIVQTLDIPPRYPSNFPAGSVHHNTGENERRVLLNYVELNADCVFVCWGMNLNVYSRHPDSEGRIGTRVFWMELDETASPCLDARLHSLPVRYLMMTNASPPLIRHGRVPGNIRIVSMNLLSLEDIGKTFAANNAAQRIRQDEFVATHVSPDGRDLVVATEMGCIIYLPDFLQKVIPGRETQYRAWDYVLDNNEENPPQSSGFAKREHQPPPNIRNSFKLSLLDTVVEYLAFDGTRILLATKSGLYAIAVRDALHPNSGTLEPRDIPVSEIKVQRLALIPHETPWTRVSCIQMTPECAWLSYPLTDEVGPHLIMREYLTYIDFSDNEPLLLPGPSEPQPLIES